MCHRMGSSVPAYGLLSGQGKLQGFDEGIAYLSGDVVISILHNRLVEKHLVHNEPCGLQLMTWA